MKCVMVKVVEASSDSYWDDVCHKYTMYARGQVKEIITWEVARRISRFVKVGVVNQAHKYLERGK